MKNETRAYVSWRQMKQRCTNPKYPGFGRYGGRGIRFCDRWKLFANFLADMGDRPEGKSLDRIDCNGNYEPSNCRWATMTEQQRNRSTNKLTQAKADAIRQRATAGESPRDLAREYGVTASLIYVIRDGRIWNAPTPREAQSIRE
jgi:hypothetical protein